MHMNEPSLLHYVSGSQSHQFYHSWFRSQEKRLRYWSRYTDQTTWQYLLTLALSDCIGKTIISHKEMNRQVEPDKVWICTWKYLHLKGFKHCCSGSPSISHWKSNSKFMLIALSLISIQIKYSARDAFLPPKRIGAYSLCSLTSLNTTTSFYWEQQNVYKYKYAKYTKYAKQQNINMKRNLQSIQPFFSWSNLPLSLAH